MGRGSSRRQRTDRINGRGRPSGPRPIHRKGNDEAPRDLLLVRTRHTKAARVLHYLRKDRQRTRTRTRTHRRQSLSRHQQSTRRRTPRTLDQGRGPRWIHYSRLNRPKLEKISTAAQAQAAISANLSKAHRRNAKEQRQSSKIRSGIYGPPSGDAD